MDHPNAFNKDGKRVKFDPMKTEHSNEIVPTRRQTRKREYQKEKRNQSDGKADHKENEVIEIDSDSPINNREDAESG